MQKFSVQTSASKGIAIGEVFLVKRKPRPAGHRLVENQEKQTETARLLAAIEGASREIRELASGNEILAAHREILEDPVLQENALLKITSENKNAEQALAETEDELCRLFGEIDDEYLKERASDIRDVCTRIMNRLQGISSNPFEGIDREVVVVADDLFPSDMALMDFTKVRGLVTRQGGPTSHVCIIARNKGIPAVVGLGNELPALLQSGHLIILDALDNEMIIAPDEKTIAAYRDRREKYNQQKEKLQQIKDLLANAGTVDDVSFAMACGASGIGLFRSEFLYMQNSVSFPDEETQFAAYKKAVELCEGKSMIIRTLDIGGDKPLPYFAMEKEENPFLGWRAIRISLNRTDVFRTQLRALLRAGAFGNLRIMFPMIVSPDELRAAKAIVENCKNELRAEGRTFNENIETGVMIETPAAVMLADDLAREAGFLSIGTNDLTQYMLAADRTNHRVKHLYDPFHPAVLRSIRQVAAAANKHGKPVGLCGEMAGDPKAAKLLLGLGLSSLSVAPGNVPEIKQAIHNTSYAQARKLAAKACKKSTVAEVHALSGPLAIPCHSLIHRKTQR
ncbi:MAG: phosphoenolpyruvate--protein phosphotransferase [Mangrovibacterium sp.]